MPALHIVAQRVRYPNGTYSAPFLSSMSRADMERFARRILADEWPEWQGCLDADGRVDVEKLEAKKARDDFDSGSARLSCAHDGRFWRTAEIWSRLVVDVGREAGVGRSRRLLLDDFAVLFHRDDEAGWHAIVARGIVEPTKAFARSVLFWLPQIEEWSDG